jgi:hypothetical protein
VVFHYDSANERVILISVAVSRLNFSDDFISLGFAEYLKIDLLVKTEYDLFLVSADLK